jgi:hypothetical protein
LDWACTVIGVLPTPQLRTGAFLAVLRDEVARRSEHLTTEHKATMISGAP